MSTIEIVPDPSLMESMRSVGYSFETAVSDLIDNSITAGATKIDVLYSFPEKGHDPAFALLDNGWGMDANELVNAMRLGSSSPQEQRNQEDLGRFGLGLKTASISQGRKVSVLSKKNSPVTGYSWDLDHLAATKTWELVPIPDTQQAKLPLQDLLNEYNSGTLVVWSKLDILTKNSSLSRDEVNEQVVNLRNHIALVFHRYLDGSHKSIKIRVNFEEVKPKDPFLQDHPATSFISEETIYIGNEPITWQAFTLPHQSLLQSRDIEFSTISGSLAENQGFYVYRNKRLVVWGTWFNLATKDQLSKLSRIKIDIPNTLDDLWTLDIKKSRANPPPIIRRRLKTVLEKLRTPSIRSYEYRGRPYRSNASVEPVWNIIEDRNTIRYEINVSHPLLSGIIDQLDESAKKHAKHLLKLIQNTFPVDSAFFQGNNDRVFHTLTEEDDDMRELIRAYWRIQREVESADSFATTISQVAPFNSLKNPEKFIKAAIEAEAGADE